MRFFFKQNADVAGFQKVGYPQLTQRNICRQMTAEAMLTQPFTGPASLAFFLFVVNSFNSEMK